VKKFKISFIYIIALAAAVIFQRPIERLMFRLSAGDFFLYLIYGLSLAFLLVIIIKAYLSGKNQDLAAALLIGGVIFFFLFLKSMVLFKLIILEFFVLGILVSRDNKKAKSIIPFLILVGAACFIEFVDNIIPGTRFYYYDVWIYSLTGLCGYISGFLLLG
jgi:hypothetical protein